jgi:hypothetical protein
MIISLSYPDSALRVRRQHPDYGVTDAELRFLVWKACQSNGNILEIGTQYGLSTRALAIGCRDKLVFTVDHITDRPSMPPGQIHEMPSLDFVGMWARGLPNVFFSIQDSKTFSYDGKDIGFVFIDGDHSFEGVRADTALAVENHRRTGKGMTIVWHDYYDHEWVSVKRFLHDFSTQVPWDISVFDGTHMASMDIPDSA